MKKIQSKKPVMFKIPPPTMSDNDFRWMLEGIMIHRRNLINYGTPFREEPNSKIIKERKEELDQQIDECNAKIKELEETKERYNQLLRTIYEEESRLKDEQKKRVIRAGTPSNFAQGR